MKKLVFMLIFNLTTANVVADEVGQKCAELASEQGGVCTQEKAEVNKVPTTEEARDNFRACMKAFVQDCRIKFTSKI